MGIWFLHGQQGFWLLPHVSWDWEVPEEEEEEPEELPQLPEEEEAAPGTGPPARHVLGIGFGYEKRKLGIRKHLTRD